jgi:hypothetical protein
MKPTSEDSGILGFTHPDDPSLLRQLGERKLELGPLAGPSVLEAYLDACQKAPFASEDTKRKWRKRLGL